MSSRLTRRKALTTLAAAAGGAVLAACGGNKPKSATTTKTATPSCTLSPEMTEGPYFISGEAVRSDITEGKPGVPLQLALAIADASSCAAIANASVDIWHADAGGNYSGFGDATSNRTFLRGVQVTDGSGQVTFKTIYPGWYMGRATHIHLKVYVGGNAVHTGQLFFNESANDAV